MRKLLVCFLLFSLTTVNAQAPTAKSILLKMLTAMDNVKTARYNLKKQERIGNKLLESEMNAKLQVTPYKVYVKNVKPNPGSEVLFAKDENNGEALVNPNAFPYVNLNLDPNGSILRKDQHHTINDLGFNYIGNMLKSQIKKDEEKFYSCLSLEGEVEWNSKKMYKLVIDNKYFTYLHHTVQKGESIVSIAHKLNVADYMIQEINPSLTATEILKPGSTIKVPNSYARKIIFYIEKQNYLPLVQIIYDDKGLFEKYELFNFVLNPVIKQEEFTSKYKDYKF